MSIFDEYASFYDVLYHDKKFAEEAEFVHKLIQECHPQAKTILDFGCGTANHALLLVNDYEICGVDQSRKMIEKAEKKRAEARADLKDRLSFVVADVRTLNLDRTFDVVLAMFHVMSYQTANEDFAAALDAARNHLEPGGLLIFDCWYGPAVLSERPMTKVKCVDATTGAIVRIAEPVMRLNDNVVDVNYQLIACESGATRNVKEKHSMRYFFLPELSQFLKAANFRLIKSCELCSEREPGPDTWSICLAAVAA